MFIRKFSTIQAKGVAPIIRSINPAPASAVSPPAASGSHRRSEEHTSELQSLMRTSYAVFCLKKKKQKQPNTSILCTNPDINRIKSNIETTRLHNRNKPQQQKQYNH